MLHIPKPSKKVASMTRLDPEVVATIRNMAEVGSRTLSRQLERLVIIGIEHSNDELEQAS